MPAMSPVRFVCMPGQSYTGSTLLAFLLDCNPSLVSVGAASGPVPRVDPVTYRCSCGELLAECDFWCGVAEDMAAAGSPLALTRTPWPTAYRVAARRPVNALAARSLRIDVANDVRDALLWRRGPVAARLRRITAANVAMARAATARSGAEVFVDSSRDPLRPRYLTAFSDADVRVVHLVRDPRGNVTSILGHRPDLDVRTAAARWHRANTEARRMRRYLPPGRWLTVRYEDLCAAPQATVDEIADFVGVRRAPLPTDFRGEVHHVLGNDMRLGGPGEVRLDERWRRDLDVASIDAIETVCGPLSRELGYSWA